MRSARKSILGILVTALVLAGIICDCYAAPVQERDVPDCHQSGSSGDVPAPDVPASPLLPDCIDCDGDLVGIQAELEAKVPKNARASIDSDDPGYDIEIPDGIDSVLIEYDQPRPRRFRVALRTPVHLRDLLRE